MYSNKPQLTVLVDGSVKVGTGLGAHVEYQLSFRTTLPGLPLTGAAGGLTVTHTHTRTHARYAFALDLRMFMKRGRLLR